jgi:hypothetical protein
MIGKTESGLIQLGDPERKGFGMATATEKGEG